MAVGRPQNSPFFARPGAEVASQFGSNGLVLPVYVQGRLGRQFFCGRRMLIDVKFFTYIFDVCVYIYTHTLCWWFGQDSLLSCLFFPLWILYTLYLPAKTMQGYHQGIQDWQIGHMKGYRDDSWHRWALLTQRSYPSLLSMNLWWHDECMNRCMILL